MLSVTVTQSGWIDATVVVAVVGAIGAFIGVLFDRYRTILEQRRQCAAAALADALLWLELPYRIRRRTSDDSPELARIAELVHHLQERHIYHSSWMDLEIPGAATEYRVLLSAIGDQTTLHMQDAWKAPPVRSAADMNVGELYTPQVDSECAAFLARVTDALQLTSFIRRQRPTRRS
jgi:hypothetical protein